jgi:hypothetical protein
MRINFNGEISLIYPWEEDAPDWLDHLQDEFCRAYDMDPDKSTVIGYLGSPDAAQDMAAWLKGQEYRVSYYELAYKQRHDDIRTVSYGLEFDDACPRFIELKLKHAE